MKKITSLRSNDRGASMVEYGLLVALIAIVGLVSISSVGSATEDKFEVIAAGLGAEGGDGGTVADPPAGEEAPADPDDESEQDTDEENNDDESEAGNHDTAGEDSGDEDSDDQAGDPDDEAGSGGESGSDDDTEPVEEEEEPVVPGSTVAGAAGSGSYYWWNDTRNGGNGAWKSSVTYQNDWIRHQYLTLEVTRIDEKGKRTTTTVKDFYVAAGGSANYEAWDNELSVKKGKYDGVMSIEVKVTGIRTSDEAWQTVSYITDGPITVVDAPDTP